MEYNQLDWRLNKVLENLINRRPRFNCIREQEKLNSASGDSRSNQQKSSQVTELGKPTDLIRSHNILGNRVAPTNYVTAMHLNSSKLFNSTQTTNKPASTTNLMPKRASRRDFYGMAEPVSTCLSLGRFKLTSHSILFISLIVILGTSLLVQCIDSEDSSFEVPSSQTLESQEPKSLEALAAQSSGSGSLSSRADVAQKQDSSTQTEAKQADTPSQQVVAKTQETDSTQNQPKPEASASGSELASQTKSASVQAEPLDEQQSQSQPTVSQQVEQQQQQVEDSAVPTVSGLGANGQDNEQQSDGSNSRAQNNSNDIISQAPLEDIQLTRKHKQQQQQSEKLSETSYNKTTNDDSTNGVTRSMKRSFGGYLGLFGRKRNQGNNKSSDQYHGRFFYPSTSSPTTSSTTHQSSQMGTKTKSLKNADFPDDYREILIQPDYQPKYQQTEQQQQQQLHNHQQQQHHHHHHQQQQQQQQQQTEQIIEQQQFNFGRQQSSESDGQTEQVANLEPGAEQTTPVTEIPIEQTKQDTNQPIEQQQEVTTELPNQNTNQEQQQQQQQQQQAQMPYIRLSNIATINSTSGSLSNGSNSGDNSGEMKLMRIYVIDLDQKLVVGGASKGGDDSQMAAVNQQYDTQQPGTSTTAIMSEQTDSNGQKYMLINRNAIQGAGNLSHLAAQVIAVQSPQQLNYSTSSQTMYTPVFLYQPQSTRSPELPTANYTSTAGNAAVLNGNSQTYADYSSTNPNQAAIQDSKQQITQQWSYTVSNQPSDNYNGNNNNHNNHQQQQQQQPSSVPKYIAPQVIQTDHWQPPNHRHETPANHRSQSQDVSYGSHSGNIGYAHQQHQPSHYDNNHNHNDINNNNNNHPDSYLSNKMVSSGQLQQMNQLPSKVYNNDNYHYQTNETTNNIDRLRYSLVQGQSGSATSNYHAPTTNPNPNPNSDSNANANPSPSSNQNPNFNSKLANSNYNYNNYNNNNPQGSNSAQTHLAPMANHQQGSQDLQAPEYLSTQAQEQQLNQPNNVYFSGQQNMYPHQHQQQQQHHQPVQAQDWSSYSYTGANRVQSAQHQDQHQWKPVDYSAPATTLASASYQPSAGYSESNNNNNNNNNKAKSIKSANPSTGYQRDHELVNSGLQNEDAHQLQLQHQPMKASSSLYHSGTSQPDKAADVDHAFELNYQAKQQPPVSSQYQQLQSQNQNPNPNPNQHQSKASKQQQQQQHQARAKQQPVANGQAYANKPVALARPSGNQNAANDAPSQQVPIYQQQTITDSGEQLDQHQIQQLQLDQTDLLDSYNGTASSYSGPMANSNYQQSNGVTNEQPQPTYHKPNKQANLKPVGYAQMEPNNFGAEYQQQQNKRGIGHKPAASYQAPSSLVTSELDQSYEAPKIPSPSSHRQQQQHAYRQQLHQQSAQSYSVEPVSSHQAPEPLEIDTEALGGSPQIPANGHKPMRHPHRGTSYSKPYGRRRPSSMDQQQQQQLMIDSSSFSGLGGYSAGAPSIQHIGHAPSAFGRPAYQPAKSLLSWEKISSVATGAAKRLPTLFMSVVGGASSSYLNPIHESQSMKSAHFIGDVSGFHRPYPLRHMSMHGSAPGHKSRPKGYPKLHHQHHNNHQQQPQPQHYSHPLDDSKGQLDYEPAQMGGEQPTVTELAGSLDQLDEAASAGNSSHHNNNNNKPDINHSIDSAASPIELTNVDIVSSPKLTANKANKLVEPIVTTSELEPEQAAVLGNIEQQLGASQRPAGRPRKTLNRAKARARVKRPQLPLDPQIVQSLAGNGELSAPAPAGELLAADDAPEPPSLAAPSLHPGGQPIGAPMPLEAAEELDQRRPLRTKLVDGLTAADGQQHQPQPLRSVQIGQYKITPQTQFVQSIIEPSRQMIGQYFKQYIGQLGQLAG